MAPLIHHTSAKTQRAEHQPIEPNRPFRHGIDTAEKLVRLSLAQCSRLSKALSDLQERLGYGDATKICSSAVGQILGWFLFEVFTPLGREFVELHDRHLEQKDWAPDFVCATSLKDAFANVYRAAEETEQLGEQLRAHGVVRDEALSELRRWTLEWRRFAERA